MKDSDSFCGQIFVEHLLCARHCSRQGSRGEQERQGPSLMESHLLSQTDKQRHKYKYQRLISSVEKTKTKTGTVLIFLLRAKNRLTESPKQS